MGQPAVGGVGLPPGIEQVQDCLHLRWGQRVEAASWPVVCQVGPVPAVQPPVCPARLQVQHSAGVGQWPPGATV